MNASSTHADPGSPVRIASPGADRPALAGRRGRLHAGFTLIEVAVVVALVGIVAAIAWPSHLAHLQRARRADAVSALMRVQLAQEQYRIQNGLYAPTLAVLRGAGAERSPEGLYDIVVQGASAEHFVVAAAARRDGPQAGDTACARLTLSLNQGMADFGPDARCWNR